MMVVATMMVVTMMVRDLLPYKVPSAALDLAESSGRRTGLLTPPRTPRPLYNEDNYDDKNHGDCKYYGLTLAAHCAIRLARLQKPRQLSHSVAS